MTPVERLQAAIEKLEQHEGETWFFASPSDEGLLSRQGWIDALNPGGGRQVLGLIGRSDAELILTLHRTIDAQLLVLRHALARAEAKIAGGGIERHVWSHEQDALTLADAILNTPALAEGDRNSHDSSTTTNGEQS